MHNGQPRSSRALQEFLRHALALTATVQGQLAPVDRRHARLGDDDGGAVCCRPGANPSHPLVRYGRANQRRSAPSCVGSVRVRASAWRAARDALRLAHSRMFRNAPMVAWVRRRPNSCRRVVCPMPAAKNVNQPIPYKGGNAASSIPHYPDAPPERPADRAEDARIADALSGQIFGRQRALARRRAARPRLLALPLSVARPSSADDLVRQCRGALTRRCDTAP